MDTKKQVINHSNMACIEHRIEKCYAQCTKSNSYIYESIMFQDMVNEVVNLLIPQKMENFLGI